ncbi:hypothetical protein D3C86_1911030 [compost metagenome]
MVSSSASVALVPAGTVAAGVPPLPPLPPPEAGVSSSAPHAATKATVPARSAARVADCRGEMRCDMVSDSLFALFFVVCCCAGNFGEPRRQRCDSHRLHRNVFFTTHIARLDYSIRMKLAIRPAD